MLKKLFFQTLSYGMSTVVARLINYIIVPLHTGFFQKQDYGSVSLFYAYIIIFNSVFTYGMETAFFRISVENPASRKTAQSLLLITTFIFTTIGLWTIQTERLWTYVLLILALDTLCVIPFAALRMENKVFLFSILKILNATLILALNFVFFGLGIKIAQINAIDWVFISNLIGSAVVFIILLPSILKTGWGIQFSLARKMLSYGWPFLFAGLFFAINEAGDRLLLELWATGNAREKIGVYSACYKLSIFITLAVQAYKFAAEPFFFKAWGQKELYSKSMTLFVAICAAMMLAISANSNWIAYILIPNSAYHVGLAIVPYLLLANLFLGMYYNFSVWYKISDKTQYAAWIGFLGATITVLANYLLIPKYGYWGSTIATLLCYALMAVACYFLGQKYYPINYEIGKMTLYITLAFIFSIISQYLVLVGNVLLLVYIVMVVLVEWKSFSLKLGAINSK